MRIGANDSMAEDQQLEGAMKPSVWRNRPNQALERTATRCVFTFQMVKTGSLEATLALGGGRSAWSRWVAS